MSKWWFHKKIKFEKWYKRLELSFFLVNLKSFKEKLKKKEKCSSWVKLNF